MQQSSSCIEGTNNNAALSYTRPLLKGNLDIQVEKQLLIDAKDNKRIVLERWVSNGTAGKNRKPNWKCTNCMKSTINRKDHEKKCFDD